MSTPLPTTSNMRVLALDPGYDRLGVAIMDRDHKNGTLLFSHCIETDRATSIPERMAAASHEIELLLTEHKPHIVALERLYFNKNAKTAMRVAELRGIMVYLARLHECTVVEYTPQEIKVAVTGYGKSDKRQVADMVKRLLPNVRKDALDDEYDAIAVAITALARER